MISTARALRISVRLFRAGRRPKQVGDATVKVRLTVSSSLNEWPNDDVTEESQSEQGAEDVITTLVTPNRQFAVSAEHLKRELQAALLQYLGEHGIDDEFAKNLVGFATSYEKKQYIGLMKRLRSFVSKK